MATNTLNDRASGQVIEEGFFNDVHAALEGDVVGRDASGIPSAGKNLGTAAFPWGSLRADSLIVGGSSVDVSQVAAPPFRVISGTVRSTSNQPAYFDPAGAAGGTSFTLLATATNLILDINGVSKTLAADIVKSGLSLAPSTNNTALIDDLAALDSEASKIYGELDSPKEITMDVAGTAITALIGTWQAFTHNGGAGGEIFYAYIESATTLKNAYRGFFQDAAQTPINRDVFSNNDTITLLKAHYVFLDTNLTTVDTTTTVPFYQAEAPGSPATGDYWFDTAINLWKRYDGASFVLVDRTYLGMVVTDDTDCLYARPVDFDSRYSRDNEVTLDLSTTEIVRSDSQGSKVNVAGNEIAYVTDPLSWNITTDLAPSADLYNATEQASTFYYMYVKDTGEEIVSDISPYWRADLFGFYHPHNPWRAVGSAFNDATSDLVGGNTINKLAFEKQSHLFLNGANGFGSTDTKIRRFSQILYSVGTAFHVIDSVASGTEIIILEDGYYFAMLIDRHSGPLNAGFGMTINSTELTTNVESLDVSNRVSYAFTITTLGDIFHSVTGCFQGRKGDVFRAHYGVNSGVAMDSSQMIVKKISSNH